MKTIKILWLVATTLIVADFAFAQTWTLTGAPNENWVSLVSSADGSKLIASGTSWLYYVSTNSGSTWITNTQPQKGSSYGSWVSIASSADGTEFVGTGLGVIWVLTNSGSAWSSNYIDGTSFFESVALSADGSKLVAVAGNNSPGPIYYSTNSGLTWTPTTAPTNLWTSVASSADGSKLAAVVGNNTTNGNVIYISTNSVNSWILSHAPTNIPWSSVASSADGSKLVAVTEGVNVPGHGITYGSIYTSTNFGMDWISNNVPRLPVALWGGVASSADGSRLVAIAQGTLGLSYSSTNSGATWTSNSIPPSPPLWYRVASSADGGKLVAAAAGGGIYTLQTTPSPQLNLTSSNTNLALSWTIPSTNFVLQQSSDLILWAEITNAPALNLTNLQNQVTLSPSNSSDFYRLKTP